MPVAYIPSPSHGVWHVGPVPIRAYALCIILGVLVAAWLASRRYVAAGGERGVILDVAAWAVPFGLIGARLYSVITDYELYVGKRHDWVAVFKVWDGGIGMPGGLALGFLGAWVACRRGGVPLGPVARACAPAIAVGQAVGSWSTWFNQQIYGRPSGLPWALEISPAHRISGYESFATFQPTFLYACLWDLLVAALVIWAARRFPLPGGRVFALYLAAYSVGMFAIQTFRIDYSHHIAGLRVNEWVALLTFLGATWYLYRTRHAHLLAGPMATEIPAAPEAGTVDAARPGGTD